MDINRYLPYTTYEESKEWFQYILNHPDKVWNYGSLSFNSNLRWEIVLENPDKPWDYI